MRAASGGLAPVGAGPDGDRRAGRGPLELWRSSGARSTRSLRPHSRSRSTRSDYGDEDFSQTSDEEVRELLGWTLVRAARGRKLSGSWAKPQRESRGGEV